MVITSGTLAKNEFIWVFKPNLTNWVCQNEELYNESCKGFLQTWYWDNVSWLTPARRLAKSIWSSMQSLLVIWKNCRLELFLFALIHHWQQPSEQSNLKDSLCKPHQTIPSRSCVWERRDCWHLPWRSVWKYRQKSSFVPNSPFDQNKSWLSWFCDHQFSLKRADNCNWLLLGSISYTNESKCDSLQHEESATHASC